MFFRCKTEDKLKQYAGFKLVSNHISSFLFIGEGPMVRSKSSIYQSTDNR